MEKNCVLRDDVCCTNCGVCQREDRMKNEKLREYVDLTTGEVRMLYKTVAKFFNKATGSDWQILPKKCMFLKPYDPTDSF